MRLKQDMFYRQTGIRERGQLARPRLIPLGKLELPLETIYHYLPDDGAVVGPSPQDPVLATIDGRLFIEHVTELTSREGGPRRTVINPQVLMNDFRRKNRLFKPLRKDQALTINRRNGLVINYAMLSALYRYIPSYKANYYRWFNVAKLFWENVQRTHERFGWNQYLELTIPETIPTQAQFNRMATSLTQENLQIFSTASQLNLLDLWLWLGDNRSASNLAVLSDEAVRKVNFLVKVKGYFFVINLGVLDDWRKDKEVENDTGLDGTALQRRFLQLLMGLQDVNSGVTQIELETDAESEESTTPVETAEADAVPTKPADKPTPRELPVSEPAPASAPSSEFALPEIPMETVLPAPKSTPEQPAVPSLVSDRKSATTAKPATPTAVLPTDDATSADGLLPTHSDEALVDGVLAKARELLDVGLMSVRAYQRTLTDATTYQRLKDPYGSGQTIAERMVISTEDLQIPENTVLPDRATIPDKSMLSSKLKAMDRHYTEHVLPKDVLNAVMAVQKQGVAVKNYQIETHRDLMNHYEVHSVTLKPVQGRQSTIRFRLPVIDKDGRFMSNGNLYRMRRQRAD